MVVDKNEPSEKIIAKLRDKAGLNSTESPNNNLFQGDFGHSIDFSTLIPSLLLFLFIVILGILFIKRRKSN